MGIDRNAIAFLVSARRLGVSFDKTLMLGRQGLLVDQPGISAGFGENGTKLSRKEATAIIGRDGYAEGLFTRLGGRRVDSLDADAYERSTIVHDLNKPLPGDLRGHYNAVFDGGTLEHVFNYPAALHNALSAVSVGGHFLSVAPMNGWVGHGFYQLSPELFYRALGQHGFQVSLTLLKPSHWRSRWRTVPDPAEHGARVVWRGAWPTLLYVIAGRLEGGVTIDRTISRATTSNLGQGRWSDSGGTSFFGNPKTPTSVAAPGMGRRGPHIWRHLAPVSV